MGVSISFGSFGKFDAKISTCTELKDVLLMRAQEKKSVRRDSVFSFA